MLIYYNPLGRVNGDVRIWSDFVGGHLSNVLRFTDSQGRLFGQSADRMIFYSELGGGTLADTGFPASFVPADNGGIVEANGEFIWQISYPPTGLNKTTYIGTSGVPEPSTGAFFGLALAGWFVFRRRKRLRPEY